MHNPDVWKIKMMGWLLKQGLTQTRSNPNRGLG